MKNNYEIAVFGENIRKLRYRENLSKQKMAKKWIAFCEGRGYTGDNKQPRRKKYDFL